MWPADPEDWTPWGKEEHEANEKEVQEQEMHIVTGRLSQGKQKEVMESLREQAEEMVKRRKLGLASWEKARQEKVVHMDAPSYRLRIWGQSE